MTAANDNVDLQELEKFAALAEKWWDTSGPFRTLHEINPLRVDYIAARAKVEGARVLDVGCGGGLLAEALAGRGAQVTGADLAEANVAIARTHAAGSGLVIDYRCENVESIAQGAPGHFDIVTCLEVLEHVPDPDRIVTACAAAVRPGGAVFFSTINRNFKSFMLAVVGAEYVLRVVPQGTHEYRKLIRPAELGHACRQAGLDLRELTGLHYNPLLRSYRLGGNVDVNYFAHTIRPETG